MGVTLGIQRRSGPMRRGAAGGGDAPQHLGIDQVAPAPGNAVASVDAVLVAEVARASRDRASPKRLAQGKTAVQPPASMPWWRVPPA